MIQVQNLTKQFNDLQAGKVTVLDHVSFSVKGGEIFGLLGPNGAGKTTCLRILSTVLQPTSGRALIDGYDVVRSPAIVRGRIGFMSCNTGIYDRMTAWEMVEYYGRLYGIEENTLQERLDQIFTQLQMNEIRDLLCSKMSTGMKQKVSIARTMIHDPEVVVFDEPTVGLDIITSRGIIDLIRECRDTGKTVLFSTHLMGEVNQLGDDIAILHRGRLLHNGPFEAFRDSMVEGSLEDEFLRVLDSAEAKIKNEEVAK